MFDWLRRKRETPQQKLAHVKHAITIACDDVGTYVELEEVLETSLRVLRKYGGADLQREKERRIQLADTLRSGQ